MRHGNQLGIRRAKTTRVPRHLIAVGLLFFLLAYGPIARTPSDDAAETMTADCDSPCSCLRDVVFLEAEDFSGPWVIGRNLAGYSGRGFAVSKVTNRVAGTSMAARVDIRAAAEYQVWVRGYADTSDRRWRLEIAGRSMSETHGKQPKAGFGWKHAGTVTLPAEELTIRILDAGKGAEVADAIVLTTEPDYDPSVEARCWDVLPQKTAESLALTTSCGGREPTATLGPNHPTWTTGSDAPPSCGRGS